MKTKYLVSLAILLSFSLCMAQETEAMNFKGIHQIESEAHAGDSREFILNKSTESIRPLSTLARSDSLSHAVFGYLPYWERDASELDYHALTHIAVFDFHVSAVTGEFSSTPSGWPNDWIPIMNSAHDNGVKTILCVTEFNDDDIYDIISNSARSNAFYADVVSYMNSWYFDGVNIDFEGLNTSDRGDRINSFMLNLTNYVHEHAGAEKEVSFAGPSVNWSGWKLKELSESCDYIFIMGYAYYYNGSSKTGPSAPIQGSTYNLEQTLISTDRGYGDVDKSKLILGLPYYGNRWEVSSSQRSMEGASTLSSGRSIFYNSTMDLYQEEGRQWSSNFYDAWCYHQISGKWYQSWCNDASSINAKHQLVFDYELMGTGMWALGYDEGRQELWTLLKENFISVDDTAVLADFAHGKGSFDTEPTYSGSSQGISTQSSTLWTQIDGDSCLSLILKDNSESDLNWKVRLLSGRGNPARNTALNRGRNISFRLKTSAENRQLKVAIMMDDSDGHEISDTLDILTDGNWHNYSMDCRPAEYWHNYSKGNGSLDAAFISFDALMFFADNGSEDIEINIDDIHSTLQTDTLSFLVSGRITKDEQGLAGVEIAGTQSNSAGYYQTRVNYPGSIFLQPVKNGYGFSPKNKNIALVNMDRIQNFTVALVDTDLVDKMDFALEQNYPNPFNPTTTIPFTLSNSGPVSLNLYHISGKLLIQVIDGYMEKGEYSIPIVLSDFPSGVYIYSLQTDTECMSKKMVYIK